MRMNNQERRRANGDVLSRHKNLPESRDLQVSDSQANETDANESSGSVITRSLTMLLLFWVQLRRDRSL